MKSLPLLLSSILIAGLSLPHRPANNSGHEPLYLPNGNALTLLSFGYRNALSNYLWMQTISYFGEHYRSDKQYKWFNHQCRLVTRLNPRSFDPFYLCTSLLAWEAGDPSAAISLLDDAVVAQPDTWIFFYFRGFYRMYFNHDHEGATHDFVEAAKRPDAHPIAARLASKTMAELESPQSAIQFLSAAMHAARDDNARRALQGRLHELVYENDLATLEHALQEMPTATSIADLVAAGRYRGALTDPFGGTYLIEGGKVRSTSGHKRLSEYKGLNRKP